MTIRTKSITPSIGSFIEPRKLRKIKTVYSILSDSVFFDNEVNEAIADGWYLVRRYTIPSCHPDMEDVLIAELQRYEDYDNE